MGLVEYSDSESDSESVPQPPAASAAPPAAANAKKHVQKVVDRSNPRRIVVNLGGAAAPDETKPGSREDEPPAKRARTGGGVFGGFASLLPPPKNAGKPPATSSHGPAAPKPGVNLKTGAAPGFSKNPAEGGDGDEGPGQNAQPSIPTGQKPADEVKLVGKPLMFKPLSVSRKPTKKNSSKVPPAVKTTPTDAAAAPSAPAALEPAPPKKKVSLFGISDEPEEPVYAAPDDEAVFSRCAADATQSHAEALAAYDAQFAHTRAEPSAPAQPTSLDSIAADMNLSKAARRQLFGRTGNPASSMSASSVVNFNMDREYAHNEEVRASGEQQAFNPVRAIAPGKHNLRQLVNQVQTQREALEESFAKGKSNRNEAGSRYGWR